MALNFDGLELSDEHKEMLNKQTESMVSQDEIDGLKRNRDELLAEKKAASEARKKAEEEAEVAKIDALEKSKNYEELYKTSQEKIQQFEDRDQARQAEMLEGKKTSKALEIAKKLADGPNAEILAEFVAKRLKIAENEVKVTDKDGQLTISTVEELVAEFKADQRFAALITVSKASGGATTEALKPGERNAQHGRGAFNTRDSQVTADRRSKIKDRLAAQGIT